MGFFGFILFIRGLSKKAEEVRSRVMSSCNRILGTDHPLTLSSMETLTSLPDYSLPHHRVSRSECVAAHGTKRLLGKACIDSDLSRVWLLMLKCTREGAANSLSIIW